MRNLILSNKAQRNIVILFIKKIDKFQFVKLDKSELIGEDHEIL